MSVTPTPESAQASAAYSFRAKRSPWDVQREVLFALIIREANARVGGQWVGAVWTLLEPLAHTLFMLALYGMVMSREAPAGEYPVFLVTGLIPFFLFQNLANRLMDGIEANRGLFAYRQVKPIDVLLARSVIECGMSLLVYFVTLGLLGWLGFHAWPADPLGMLGSLALVILLGMGLGILMAVLTHDRPRLRSMVRMAMFPLYLISGVIFPIDSLPREVLEPLLWNPVLHVLELSRHAFIPAYVPVEGVSALFPLMTGMAWLALGLLMYRAKRQQLVST